jgi:DNA topoisomerase-2
MVPQTDDFELLTEVEAILKKPAPYVGEVEPVSYDDLVPRVDELANNGRLVLHRRTLLVSQALLKICGEMLDNASDHAKRDPTMNKIEVKMGADGRFSVENNGTGITTNVHAKHNMRVPEMIFGHLHAGSNFGEERGTLQGQNGLGVKLALLFADEGYVRVVSEETRECWTQRTQLGLTNPKRTCKPAPKAARGSVLVEVLPDYRRFGVHDEASRSHAQAALLRMVVDLAATVREGVRVTLLLDSPEGTGSVKRELTKITKPFMPATRTQSKYFSSMFPQGTHFWTHECTGWRITLAMMDDEQDRPRTLTHASFVNGCRTVDGGSHLDAVQAEVRKALMLALGSKHDGVSMFDLCARLFIGIDAEVQNPRFTSQCKTLLSNQRRELPSLSLGATEGKAILNKLDGLKEVVSMLRARSDQRTASRADGKKSRTVLVKGLKDANLAGGPRSNECRLIVAEGDSAMQLALAGIAATKGGNDIYGVFKYKGKPPNGMKMSKAEACKNDELGNFIKAMGLRANVDFEEEHGRKQLRYGSVLLLTDQDPDGDHICGVSLGTMLALFPSFVRAGVMFRFITPVVKATREGQTLEFYSLQDKDAWWEDVPHEQRPRWRLKYYKGLGASTNAEGRDYFRDIERLIKRLAPDQGHSEALQLAFGPDASKRKPWLTQDAQDAKQLDPTDHEWDISGFVHGPVRNYSLHSIRRAIPSAVDGLIPARRKALMAAMEHLHTTKEIKLIELTGKVISRYAYHNGDASMNAVIVNMAQGYVGRLNWRLMQPIGQFGSRLSPPSVHAAPRYLSTRPADILGRIFTTDDLAISRQQDDDGKRIEPCEFQCAFPLALVNGVPQALATGFSSYIPPHNPRDVAKVIIAIAEGQEPPPLTPWFKGFKGTIEQTNEGTFIAKGTYQRTGDTVRVTELPPGTWTNKFIDALVTVKAAPAATKRAKAEHAGVVKNITFASNMDVDEVDLTLHLVTGTDDHALTKALDAAGMRTTISYNNMNLLVPDGTNGWKIRRFETPIELARWWTAQRLEAIARRKAHTLQALKDEARTAHVKSAFCDAVRSGALQLYHRGPDGAIHPEEDGALHGRIRAAIPEITQTEITTLEALNWCTYVKNSAADRLRRAKQKADEEMERLSAKGVIELMREDIAGVNACAKQ